MITTKLMNDVKNLFARTGEDLELTYNEFKDQLTPKEIYDICINKAKPKDELPKEDLKGNRLNPFVRDEEPDEKNIVASNPDFKVIKGKDITIDINNNEEDNKKCIIVDGTIEENAVDNRVDTKPTYLTKPAMIISTKDDTLNYESIGFAIGFKNADADDLLAMANGNALQLVPALQWLYGQTDDEGIRNRIEELTLDVLFNK